MTDDAPTPSSKPARAMRVFSGVQPTANIHLGNYLGAIRRFVDLQHEAESLFCVVDLHAITVPQDPARLIHQTREVAAAYLASGIDPEKAVVFVQSAVSAHAELAWVLNCVARMGWLERMTQFKDKAGKNAERVSVGLFAYPVLMAADILAYQATHVPVGEDQKQHLELARDIAGRFNADFKAEDFFPLPEPLIGGPAARVMNLQDGGKKMSKSDPADLSRINLTDDADAIARKIKKARTDPAPLPTTVEGLQGRPEVDNLVGIYAALADKTKEQVLLEFNGAGFGAFKPNLVDLAVAKLSPISEGIARHMADPAELDRLLAQGAARARAIAEPVMRHMRTAVGFWQ
jgi:tryptophanyl-tRNA synthetase